MGWYDYSARPPHLAYDDAALRAMKQLVNHDADYIDWPWSDVAMARYLAKGLCRPAALRGGQPRSEPDAWWLPTSPSSSRRCLTIPRASFWSLMRAYAGNFTLGELVRHIAQGHARGQRPHPPRGCWTVPGDYGPIDVRLVGSQKAALRAVVLEL